jgi:uncharacterized coiled-coil protein SlyX
MENESELNEVTNPDAIIEVDSNLVYQLMQQHAEHLDRSDERIAQLEELLLGLKRALSLLGTAVAGHQAEIEQRDAKIQLLTILVDQHQLKLQDRNPAAPLMN